MAPKLTQDAAAAIDKRIDLKLVITNQELGRQFGLLSSKIDQLHQQIETLRAENGELRQNLINLHTEYEEVRNYAQRASESASNAKADNRYMERSIERVNIIAEIINVFVDVLVPVHAVLDKILKKREALDPRRYSRQDGVDITRMVDNRKR